MKVTSEVKKISGDSCSIVCDQFINGMTIAIASIPGSEDIHITLCDSIEYLFFYAGENSTVSSVETREWTAEEFIRILGTWGCQESKKPPKKAMQILKQFA